MKNERLIKELNKRLSRLYIAPYDEFALDHEVELAALDVFDAMLSKIESLEQAMKTLILSSGGMRLG